MKKTTFEKWGLYHIDGSCLGIFESRRLAWDAARKLALPLKQARKVRVTVTPIVGGK